jgi:hypothetical protein
LEKIKAEKRKARMTAEIIDGLRRTILHYGLWFKEVENQVGLQNALKLEEQSWQIIFPTIMKRLARVFEFKVDSMGTPYMLLEKSEEELQKILSAISANWLAVDGIWFQSVENNHDIFTAKKCNDACWSRFSPLEARHIMILCGLPEKGGLEALKEALSYRLYANINKHFFERPDRQTLIYRMKQCRVQEARNRKGMADYPCKSGGLIEYISFAQTIDPAIITECLACPPDPHPVDWFCSWKFTLS